MCVRKARVPHSEDDNDDNDDDDNNTPMIMTEETHISLQTEVRQTDRYREDGVTSCVCGRRVHLA